MKPISQ